MSLVGVFSAFHYAKVYKPEVKSGEKKLSSVGVEWVTVIELGLKVESKAVSVLNESGVMLITEILQAPVK